MTLLQQIRAFRDRQVPDAVDFLHKQMIGELANLYIMSNDGDYTDCENYLAKCIEELEKAISDLQN